MYNLIDTIESQYANSPKLLALLESFNESVDPSLLIDDFYAKVWNVDTAEGYGLDIWGRIVVIGRVIKLLTAKRYMWWDEATPSGNSWGFYPWYKDVNNDTTSYSLSDAAFRLLILVKAMANIADGSIPTYNRILMSLFPGRGNAYVVDNLDMTIDLTFDFVLEPFEISILEHSGVFPAPCGQKINIVST